MLEGLFDCHLHTRSSHDSEADPLKIAESAFSKGLYGFCFTDHINIGVEGEKFLNPAYSLHDDYLNLLKDPFVRNIPDHENRILLGLEVGESIRNPEAVAKMISDLPLDMVLGSVHKIYIDGEDFCFSDHLFRELPPDFVRRVVKIYYEDVLETAEKSDIDVVAHLNLINRYELDFTKRDLFDPELGHVIRDILAVIIERDLALEINASRYKFDFFMPGLDVFKEYKKMGGRLVTLGSDAHSPENLGQGFEKAREILLEAGFKDACYFRNRKPVPYALVN